MLNVEQVFILPLPLIAVTLSFLGAYVLRRSRMTIRFSFFTLMVMMSLAVASEWLILSSNDLDEALLFNDIQYIGNVVISPLTLVFVMRYVSLDNQDIRRRLHPLFVIPAICLVMVWTNPWHHLYYTSVDLIEIMGFHTLEYDIGPFMVLHTFYNVLMIVISIIILLSYAKGAKRRDRWNPRIMSVALAIPLIFSVFVIVSSSGAVTVYAQSYGFLIASVIAFWMVFRYELLDMTPIIHSKLLEEMPQAAIILDDLAMVKEINRAGEQLTGIGRDDVDGLHFKDLFDAMSIADDVSLDTIVKGGTFECGSIVDGVWRTLEMHSTSLKDVRGQELGYLVTIDDKTEVESLMESLRMANSKLNMMSSITRHDILNQATVVDGYSKLLERMDLPPKAIRDVERIRASVGRIIDMIDFTRTYQDLGIERPSWHSPRDEFEEALHLVDVDCIDIANALGDHEILVDRLLRNVMVNLVDNSLRHGGDSISHLRIEDSVEDGTLVITYSDDGGGVEEELKERIFERDFGLHTGIGMFVSREILQLTDITIEEVGREGEGAVFEIRVPRGRWRSDGRSHPIQSQQDYQDHGDRQ